MKHCFLVILVVSFFFNCSPAPSRETGATAPQAALNEILDQDMILPVPETETVEIAQTAPELPRMSEQKPVPETKAPDIPIPVVQSPQIQTPAPQQKARAGTLVNGVLYLDDRALMSYGGTDSAVKTYAAVLNVYKKYLGDSVNVYDLIVPTSVIFYVPDNYRKITANQKARIDLAYSLLEGITGVDAYTELAARTDEYLYYKTDHHWTHRGAYWGYVAFCKAAGIEPLPIDHYKRDTREGFIGSFFTSAEDKLAAAFADTFEYFLPPEPVTVTYRESGVGAPFAGPLFWENVSMKNSYMLFQMGDGYLVQIDTENKNGRKLMIIKESFGNAIVSWFVPHFEQIIEVDIRYFKGNVLTLLREKGITDLLFVNNIVSTGDASRINNLVRIRDGK